MTTRKYLAEGGMTLYSSGANLITPHRLYDSAKDPVVREIFVSTNIYLIVRRRRITFCPSSLKVINGVIHGKLRVHFEDSYETFPFCWEAPDGVAVDKVTTSGYLNSTLVIFFQNGTYGGFPSYKILETCKTEMDEHNYLDVLYVGQAFGRTGKRIALDRLQTHKTLQRILADTLNEAPDHEVLILMYRYEHGKNLLDTTGDHSLTPTATSEEEKQHHSTISNANFARRARIAMAEAGLIRYFQPKYNILYKQTFPSKKHKILHKAFSLDFSGVVIEIDSSNINCCLYSENLKKPNYYQLDHKVQIAKFPLYTQDERESFLHAYL